MCAYFFFPLYPLFCFAARFLFATILPYASFSRANFSLREKTKILAREWCIPIDLCVRSSSHSFIFAPFFRAKADKKKMFYEFILLLFI